MQRSKKTEFGRTMTEMLSVVVVMSLIMVATLAGLKHMREKATVSSLQTAVATKMVQRIHSLQSPLASKANPVNEKGPYGYPIHIENGVTGAKAEYFWITLGAFEGNNPKTLSYSVCKTFLNTMNSAITPAALEINGIPKPVDQTACIDTPNGMVMTLLYPKDKRSYTSLEVSCNPPCSSDQTCLSSGCCDNDNISTVLGVCCQYINGAGECVYKGHNCPNGQVWDDTTGSCLSNCPGSMTWKSGHCTCPDDKPLFQNGQCTVCTGSAPICQSGANIHPENGCPCECLAPLHESDGLCLPDNICSGKVCLFLCRNSECVCPANTYGNGETCTMCPENSSSAAGMNSSISDCTCYPGYVKDNQGFCVLDTSNLGEDCSAQGLATDPNTQRCVCDSSNTSSGRYYLKNGTCVQCPQGTHIFTGTDCYVKTCSGEHQKFKDNVGDYIPGYTGTISEYCKCDDQYVLDNNSGECVPCRGFIESKLQRNETISEGDCQACMATVWRNASCRPCQEGEHAQKIGTKSTSCATCKSGYYKNDEDVCTQCPNGYTTEKNDTDSYETAIEACVVCSSDTVSLNKTSYCCPEGGCCTESVTSSCLTCQTNADCPSDDGIVCDTTDNKCKRLCRDGMFPYYLGNPIHMSSDASGYSLSYGDKIITVSGNDPFKLTNGYLNAIEIVSIQGSNGVLWDTLYHNPDAPTCNVLTSDCPIVKDDNPNEELSLPDISRHYYKRYKITALWRDTGKSMSYTATPLQSTKTQNGLYCSPIKF